MSYYTLALEAGFSEEEAAEIAHQLTQADELRIKLEEACEQANFNKLYEAAMADMKKVSGREIVWRAEEPDDLPF